MKPRARSDGRDGAGAATAPAAARSARWIRLLVSRSTSPADDRARAISYPVLPVKTLPQSRTASIRSRVLPAGARKRGRAGAFIVFILPRLAAGLNDRLHPG